MGSTSKRPAASEEFDAVLGLAAVIVEARLEDDESTRNWNAGLLPLDEDVLFRMTDIRDIASLVVGVSGSTACVFTLVDAEDGLAADCPFHMPPQVGVMLLN